MFAERKRPCCLSVLFLRTWTPKSLHMHSFLKLLHPAQAIFQTRCFWSYDPRYVVQLSDNDWVVRELRRHRNRGAWEVAAKLSLRTSV